MQNITGVDSCLSTPEENLILYNDSFVLINFVVWKTQTDYVNCAYFKPLLKKGKRNEMFAF